MLALNDALFKLATMVSDATGPTDIGRNQAVNGLQLISAMATNGTISLLLDGPKLFPMLLRYLQDPWIKSGISHVAFAVVYNLCVLSPLRLPVLVQAGGIKVLVEYLKKGIDANPTGDAEASINQKRNLVLAVLYLIGSGKNELQQQFLDEGGLTCVLDYFKTAKSVLPFLSNFVSMQTPTSAISIIMSHPDFSEAVDAMYTENADDMDEDFMDAEEDEEEADPEELRQKIEESAKVQMVAQTLRNLCLLQGSAETILPLLPRFLGHSPAVANEALSALSNLVGTQAIDFRYAWDSSLIGMTLSRSAQLCNVMLEQAAADEAAAVLDTNVLGRKSVLARALQILRADECFKVASESCESGRPGREEEKEEEKVQKQKGEKSKEPEDDASDSDSENAEDDYEDNLVFTRDDAERLVHLAKLNTDLLEANQSWARTISRYLALVPSKYVWVGENDGLVDTLADAVLAEKDATAELLGHTEGEDANNEAHKAAIAAFPKLYTDSELDLAKMMQGVTFQDNANMCVMFRRLSNMSIETGKLPTASFDTISLGVIGSSAIAVVLTAITRNLRTLLSVFRLPAGAQSKWGSAAITVKLFDIRNNATPVTVSIDDKVPCYVCGRPIGLWTGSTQTWLPLIEKACAKLLGGYAALSSLTIEEASELLTGSKAVAIKINSDSSSLLKTISSELAEKNQLMYQSTTEPKAMWVIDSLSQSESDGTTINAYSAGLFDSRRGWVSDVGRAQLTLPQLQEQINTLYKLKLE